MAVTGTTPAELLIDIDSTIRVQTGANTITPTTHSGLLDNIVSVLSGDTYTTGGTYVYSASTINFTTSDSGVTYSVSGITDTFVSGGTYSGGTLTIGRNDGVDITVNGFSTGGTSSSPFQYNSGEATAIEPVLGTNVATDIYSFIGGGRQNIVSGSDSTIGGGISNTASGYNSFIGGGTYNLASDIRSVVAGGLENITSGYLSFIGAGSQNTASGRRNSIGGGRSNLTDSSFTVIGGGDGNTATGFSTTISGGKGNTATATHSTIGGGRYNTTSGGGVYYGHSTVGGGEGNTASGTYYDHATVGGGKNNTASGDYSSIIGGKDNTASHLNSHIIGSSLTSVVDNTTMVNDLIIDNLKSNTNLATDANGKITGTPSDERLKTNVNDLTESLDKINKLRGVSFEWTEESNMGTGTTKFGLIAQEVQEIIPEMISTMSKDSDILTLDYKELVPFLVESIKEQQTQINDLTNRINELEK